jgi:excisionase family DNA binding protein
LPSDTVVPTTAELQKALLNVDEVAALLGCGRTLVYSLFASGELPFIKIGRLTKVPVGVVEQMVARKLRAAEDYVP